MKLVYRCAGALCLLLLAAGAAGAQDRRTLETKVADLLSQLPTEDLGHRDRLMREMIGMGPGGLLDIAGRLAPPATAAVRMHRP